MDLIKQYLVQSLTAASNNLRLNSHQIEALGLLKECIINSDDVGHDIEKMKKITELSTLGIRLSELYNYIAADKIDFFDVTRQFASHSKYIINDLNHILEFDNPELIKKAIGKINSGTPAYIKTKTTDRKDLHENNNEYDTIQLHAGSEEEEAGVFNSYESIILKPIRPIDTMLKKLVKNEVNYEDLSRFAEIMKINGEISEKNGFELISKMHNILCRALLLIRSRGLLPGKHVVLSMRSCLIVIVAIVKGKDIDITKYLTQAEDFEREIDSTKIRI